MTDFRQQNRKSFICVPFNRLPKEREGHPFNSEEVEKNRDEIRNSILGKDNEKLMEDPKAMALLRELGSDTNINAFALNFYLDKENTRLNTDIEEANYFMKRVVDKLSVTTSDTDPTKIPVFLTSTKFEPKLYGKCAQTFMTRLGLTVREEDSTAKQKNGTGELEDLDVEHESLFVLRNVVMSPFPTQHYFIGKLAEAFAKVADDEVEHVRTRNDPTAHKTPFLLQGTDPDGKTYLVLQTSFHTATLRQQLIVSAELEDKIKKKYLALKKDRPQTSLLLVSKENINLEERMTNLPTKPLKFSAQMVEKEEYCQYIKNSEK